MTAFVDTRAPNGRSGMLLLDPENATIDNTADSGNLDTTGGVFTTNDNADFTVTWTTLNGVLNTTGAEVRTVGLETSPLRTPAA